MKQYPLHRDHALDFFRACLLVYVVCLIHPVYWLKTGGEPFKSLILFEMPLIFFVAGAAAGVAGYSGRPFLGVLKSRVWRIVMPFAVFVMLSLMMAALVSPRYGLRFPAVSLRGYVMALVLGNGIPGVPYSGHLWFVPVYLIVSLSTPLQMWVVGLFNSKRVVYLLFCFFMYGGAYIVQIGGILQYDLSQMISSVFLYNIFYVSGLLFYKKVKLRTLIALAVVALLLLAILYGGDLSGMQDHKFSQDPLFLSFGMAVLLLFSCLFSFVKIGGDPGRLFRLGLGRWHKYGYTIYLWQNWCFFLLSPLVAFALGLQPGSAWSLCWLVPLFYIVSWLASLMIVPVENVATKSLKVISARLRQLVRS